MRILIVGIGALGGTIATRAIAAGMPVWLATRTPESAADLRSAGLRVSGIGGSVAVGTVSVAPLEEYRNGEPFDLVLLATKAREALEIAPFLASRLAAGGTLLPIQNGGVSQILHERLGDGVLLGGLSNLGATMVAPGVYEQRNAGHLLIGELPGGTSDRAARVAHALRPAVEVRVTANLRGAIWSKLLLNCAVTTLGAVAAQTMRQYMTSPAGRECFRRLYDEAFDVALATGSQPERMLVDPIPPRRAAPAASAEAHDRWVEQILAAYGDLKPSMLQDFERGRPTEIDFLNGYVAQLGRQLGRPVGLNAAITDLVHQIEQGRVRPAPERIEELLRRAG